MQITWYSKQHHIIGADKITHSNEVDEKTPPLRIHHGDLYPRTDLEVELAAALEIPRHLL